MLSNVPAAGNSNENSTHGFLHTVQLNYKANHLDSLFLFCCVAVLKLEVKLSGGKKTKLEQVSPFLQDLRGCLIVAMLLQIPGLKSE